MYLNVCVCDKLLLPEMAKPEIFILKIEESKTEKSVICPLHVYYS